MQEGLTLVLAHSVCDIMSVEKDRSVH